MFVKICGITRLDDALAAIASGADAIGLIFAPGSRREVDVAAAREIVAGLPPETLSVGVFRDERPDRVVEIVREVGLRGAQLHGSEAPDAAEAVRPHVELLVKAFSTEDPALARVDDYPVDAVLLDSSTPGSGVAFDWTQAVGPATERRVILAGGLTPANVAAAVAQVRPWGVDVASGVEASPGRKDPDLVRRFVERARTAGSEFSAPDGDA